MASRRRPGLPEHHELQVDVGDLGAGAAADIPDFLDMESTPLAKPPTPPPRAPRDEKPKASAPAPTPARLVQPPPVAPPPARPPAVKTEPPPAPAPAQAVRARGRARPPRKEIGFDDETLGMLKDLHADGVAQSMEESLTRSEVARAALRAIHAARNLVDYSRIGPRGKWGGASARALVDDLTDAFVRAVGEFFKDRYPPEGGVAH